ncbi:hypothetical protein DEO72_LG8g2065 [Vigna unguiculata]|uniref:Uncharacterized protein n=1 Tax=Vigna unguiculata TaxID=3917 RepID=A0A4D6MTS4_VIGUN|nr:hypothetical protein DEO72_LG8g2064 [Vigna unguiculata]QCE04033.1 hypothetical protein DEO72_LG8g2065 [Vigna unguiculata]
MEADSEGSKFHLYETDALKVVSTYQQKFGRSCLFTNDELPSPTPTGDCDDMVVDTNEKVCSASTGGFLTSTKPTLIDQPPVSATSMDKSRMLGLINSRVDAAGPGSFLVKSSAKSRDPRRQLINSEARAVDKSIVINNMPKVEYVGSTISRKQKAVEGPFDAQSLQDDYSRKIHMKPRDPRRIVHTNNSVQKSENIVNELHKAIVSPVSNS